MPDALLLCAINGVRCGEAGARRGCIGGSHRGWYPVRGTRGIPTLRFYIFRSGEHQLLAEPSEQRDA